MVSKISCIALFGLLALSFGQTPPVPNCVRRNTRPPALTTEQRTAKGPQFGTLVVAGGSLARNSVVFQRFLAEAGGANNAKILYVPTNGGGSYETPAQREQELQAFVATAAWQNLRYPVELIHTYNRAVADTPTFVAPIEEATGIFFAGGRPFWSYDAYKGTETERAIERLLRRGGVLGGSSAGALMQGNIMPRGDRLRGNGIMLGDPFIGFAFGAVENLIFDVHNLQRNRGHDLLEVMGVYPLALGINIDEDTAVVMRGDVMEAVGTGWVQIFDPTGWQRTTEVPWCADFTLSMGSGRVLVPGGGRSHFMWALRRDRYNVNTRVMMTTALTDAEIQALSLDV